jgi:hypothetical protein
VTDAGAATRTAREVRRADALRRNLGRRKTQARARLDGQADGEANGSREGPTDAAAGGAAADDA